MLTTVKPLQHLLAKLDLPECEGPHRTTRTPWRPGSPAAPRTSLTSTTSSSRPPLSQSRISSYSHAKAFDLRWLGLVTDLYITVDVNRDSDADGTAEAGDGLATDAGVEVLLIHDTNNSGRFGDVVGAVADEYWVTTGTTNGKGQAKFKLAYAYDGDYQVQMTNLTHDTLTWSSSLDADNPDRYYGVPGGSEGAGASGLRGTASASRVRGPAPRRGQSVRVNRAGGLILPVVDLLAGRASAEYRDLPRRAAPACTVVPTQPAPASLEIEATEADASLVSVLKQLRLL